MPKCPICKTLDLFEAIYTERFGLDDYAKIKAIREWLQTHPNWNMLIAYLLDKDPYSG